MEYNILYKKSVQKDIKNIDKKQLKKIISSIELKLTKDAFSGKPLAGEFEGLFRLRVGNYRVVYTIIKRKDILVLRIKHRKEVYR